MALDVRQQLTKTCSVEPSLPSNDSSRSANDRLDSIAVLLNRLALHCPVRNLPEAQAALLMQDTISDLLPYDPRQVAEACTRWRQGSNPFFPISGQLIAFIKEASEARIPHPGGHARVTFRAPKQIEGPRGSVKPWQQILAEKGKRFVAPSEAEAPASKPAQQETVLPDGSLTEQRRAELRGLRVKIEGRNDVG